MGKNFLAEYFQKNSNHMSIKTKANPVNAANFMIIVRHYHKAVCSASRLVQKEYSCIAEAAALQMACISVNDSLAPDCISTTLAVYVAISTVRTTRDRLVLSTNRRDVAVKKPQMS